MAASKIRATSWGFAVTCMTAIAATAAAQTPIKLATEDGATSVTIGALAQAFVQRDTASDRSTTDLYLRRARIVIGGTVQRKLKFFLDSDTPFLGRRNGTWSAPPTIVQDAFVTYTWRTGLQVDAGLMLVANSYNSTQSAASLLAIGYGPYSFLASAPTYSRIGRDQGVQLRGYVAGGHLEYRAGIFRGLSRVKPDAAPRYAGRVVWYPFTAQTGYFYAGTFQGRKKTLAIGASIDHENSFHSFGADIFGEWPARAGTFTFQADVLRYDGGRTFAQLPRQTTWLVEAGYLLPNHRAGGFAQWARQDIRTSGAADALSTQIGISYWLRPTSMNLKLGIGRTSKDRAPSHTQLLFQAQCFVF